MVACFARRVARTSELTGCRPNAALTAAVAFVPEAFAKAIPVVHRDKLQDGTYLLRHRRQRQRVTVRNGSSGYVHDHQARHPIYPQVQPAVVTYIFAQLLDTFQEIGIAHDPRERPSQVTAGRDQIGDHLTLRLA